MEAFISWAFRKDLISELWELLFEYQQIDGKQLKHKLPGILILVQGYSYASQLPSNYFTATNCALLPLNATSFADFGFLQAFFFFLEKKGGVGWEWSDMLFQLQLICIYQNYCSLEVLIFTFQWEWLLHQISWCNCAWNCLCQKISYIILATCLFFSNWDDFDKTMSAVILTDQTEA